MSDCSARQTDVREQVYTNEPTLICHLSLFDQLVDAKLAHMKSDQAGCFGPRRR